ncbi:MAG: sensor histidine kinase [Bacteroidota bacterium]
MKNKELQLVSELSSYKGKSILFRIGSVSVVALAFMLLSANMVSDDGVIIPVSHYFRVIIIFNILSEANVLLDNLFERFFPIPSRIKLRILLHLFISLLVGFLALLYFENQIHNTEVLQQPITWLMFAFGLIFVFILIVISISIRITSKWILTQKEVEELKHLQMKNDYNALQDQLNPHFLFNNLSVLISMIRYNPDAAVTFTQNFTDSYRYVLQNRDKTTVSLADELGFIESYIALHKERLGEALNVSIQTDRTYSERKIPPLSLQLLIENAIKHNEVSKENPLFVKIYNQGDYICVENNFQPRESSYSTSKGLKNLTSRYEFLTDRRVSVIRDHVVFRVELPLL